MRGLTRIAGSVVLAGALAGAVAGNASAMAINGPGCTARAVAIVAPSGSCGFDSPTDWASYSVEPVGGSVSVTVTCRDPYGYVRTSTRTVSTRSNWSGSAYGTCSLILNLGTATAATATAIPAIRPIYEPW